jgi:hypothetical protein
MLLSGCCVGVVGRVESKMKNNIVGHFYAASFYSAAVVNDKRRMDSKMYQIMSKKLNRSVTFKTDEIL